jgi:hypothetical protein
VGLKGGGNREIVFNGALYMSYLLQTFLESTKSSSGTAMCRRGKERRADR